LAHICRSNQYELEHGSSIQTFLSQPLMHRSPCHKMQRPNSSARAWLERAQYLARCHGGNYSPIHKSAFQKNKLILRCHMRSTPKAPEITHQHRMRPVISGAWVPSAVFTQRNAARNRTVELLLGSLSVRIESEFLVDLVSEVSNWSVARRKLFWPASDHRLTVYAISNHWRLQAACWKDHVKL
jgi:hypothetical protein